VSGGPDSPQDQAPNHAFARPIQQATRHVLPSNGEHPPTMCSWSLELRGPGAVPLGCCSGVSAGSV